MPPELDHGYLCKRVHSLFCFHDAIVPEGVGSGVIMISRNYPWIVCLGHLALKNVGTLESQIQTLQAQENLVREDPLGVHAQQTYTPLTSPLLSFLPFGKSLLELLIEELAGTWLGIGNGVGPSLGSSLARQA